jgi:hypothetical protein
MTDASAVTSVRGTEPGQHRRVRQVAAALPPQPNERHQAIGDCFLHGFFTGFAWKVAEAVPGVALDARQELEEVRLPV